MAREIFDKIDVDGSGSITADEYESTAASSNSDRSCTAATVCGESSYMSQPPTTSNTVCTALTACTNDQFEGQAPAASTLGCSGRCFAAVGCSAGLGNARLAERPAPKSAAGGGPASDAVCTGAVSLPTDALHSRVSPMADGRCVCRRSGNSHAIAAQGPTFIQRTL